MRNYEENVAFIQSDAFGDLVVAKFLHTNRIMEDAECIFIPISKNWREKLKNHSGTSPKTPSSKTSVDEPTSDSVYRGFLESIKNLVHLEGGEICKSDGQYPQSSQKSLQPKQPGSGGGQEKVEVKVVTLKTTPQKTKDFIVALYKDKNQNLTHGIVIDNPNRLTFQIDFSSYHGSFPRDRDGKLGICRFSKWRKENIHPTATFICFLDAHLLEKTLVEKRFEFTLQEYPEDMIIKCQHDELSANLFQPIDLEEELKTRKDYRERSIISMESDYYESKEVTLSIQSSPEGEDAELTIYFPDFNYYIPHNSILDLEARKRMMSFNLPDKEYPMLPHFAYDRLHFNPGHLSLAIAVSVPLSIGGSQLSFKSMPVIEKCIISPLSRHDYNECEALLTQGGKELDSSQKEVSEKDNYSSRFA